MKKLLLILIFLSIFSQNSFAKNTPVATSTEGIENFDGTVVEKSVQNKNEQKEQTNRSKEYIRLKNKCNKLELKRKHEEKEQEYLENRLELKKQKLEQFDSDTVKGEN